MTTTITQDISLELIAQRMTYPALSTEVRLMRDLLIVNELGNDLESISAFTWNEHVQGAIGLANCARQARELIAAGAHPEHVSCLIETPCAHISEPMKTAPAGDIALRYYTLAELSEFDK